MGTLVVETVVITFAAPNTFFAICAAIEPTPLTPEPQLLTWNNSFNGWGTYALQAQTQSFPLRHR
jgi:hypothetical protein